MSAGKPFAEDLFVRVLTGRAFELLRFLLFYLSSKYRQITTANAIPEKNMFRYVQPWQLISVSCPHNGNRKWRENAFFIFSRAVFNAVPQLTERLELRG